jgi:hypothetical protein
MKTVEAKQDSNAKTWIKPELVRLGTIADVANNQGAGPQGAGAKT